MNRKPTKGKPAKQSGRTFISKGISIDPQFYDAAMARAESLGMKWSEYVTGCLKRDLAHGGDFVIPSHQVISPKKQ
jgi:hypothetical protein